jgi:hypothetical protein
MRAGPAALRCRPATYISGWEEAPRTGSLRPRSDAGALPVHAQEVLGEAWDVLGAVPQGWQPDGEHVRPTLYTMVAGPHRAGLPNECHRPAGSEESERPIPGQDITAPATADKGRSAWPRLLGPRSPREAWAAPRPPFPLVDR